MLTLWKTAMKAPKTLRSIQPHQLAAIAKRVLMVEPSITDSEWKARTKETLAKQGWANPEPPEMLETALWNVEKALERQWGPRPVPTSPRAAPSVPRQQDPPWRGRHRADGRFTDLSALMVALMQNLPHSRT